MSEQPTPMYIYQARFGDGECANVIGTFATLEGAQRYCETHSGYPETQWRGWPAADGNDSWDLMTNAKPEWHTEGEYKPDWHSTAYDVICYEVQR